MEILRIRKFYSRKQICPCDRNFSTFIYTRICKLCTWSGVASHECYLFLHICCIPYSIFHWRKIGPRTLHILFILFKVCFITLKFSTHCSSVNVCSSMLSYRSLDLSFRHSCFSCLNPIANPNPRQYGIILRRFNLNSPFILTTFIDINFIRYNSLTTLTEMTRPQKFM